MDFEEFCAAAISPYQLESLEGWEQIASTAFEYFEKEGNRVISVEELVQVPIRCSGILCKSNYLSEPDELLFAGTEPSYCPFHCARLDQTIRWQAQFSWIHQVFAWCHSS